MRQQVAKMLPDVILKLIESLSDTRPAVKQAALKVFPEVRDLYVYIVVCILKLIERCSLRYRFVYICVYVFCLIHNTCLSRLFMM